MDLQIYETSVVSDGKADGIMPDLHPGVNELLSCVVHSRLLNSNIKMAS